MTEFRRHDITLRRYSEDDLGLLTRVFTDPGLRVHLGGPRTPEYILERHQRYVAAKDGMFIVVKGSEWLPVGWIGYWESAFRDPPVWEMGWVIFEEHQHQGIAYTAALDVIDRARNRGLHRYLHATVSVDNRASNDLCRRLGFQLCGEFDDEHPPGRHYRANDWRLDLQGSEST